MKDCTIDLSKRGQMRDVAARFATDLATVAAAVERYRHCNCKHHPLPGQIELPRALPDELMPLTVAADQAVTPFGGIGGSSCRSEWFAILVEMPSCFRLHEKGDREASLSLARPYSALALLTRQTFGVRLRARAEFELLVPIRRGVPLSSKSAARAQRMGGGRVASQANGQSQGTSTSAMAKIRSVSGAPTRGKSRKR